MVAISPGATFKQPPSFEEFEHDLGARLNTVHPGQKTSLSIRLYKLAVQMVELGNHYRWLEQQALKIRAATVNQKQVLTELRRAIASIDRASSKADDANTEMFQTMNVPKARESLSRAAEFLEWNKNNGFPVLIDRRLRTRRERQLVLAIGSKLSRRPSQLPKGAEVAHSYIRQLDQCLNKSRTSNGKRISRRGPLIQYIVDKYFGEYVTLNTIRTARYRRHKR